MRQQNARSEAARPFDSWKKYFHVSLFLLFSSTFLHFHVSTFSTFLHFPLLHIHVSPFSTFPSTFPHFYFSTLTPNFPVSPFLTASRSPAQASFYRPASIDELSMRDFLKEFAQNSVAWVDQLNSAMNRGAAAAQLAIGSEDENAALDANELGRMVGEMGWIEGQAMERLTAHCKRQEDLVATRISDLVQIVDVVVKALNDAQQRCLALEAQKNAAGTQGNKAGNTLGIGGMGTSEILNLRERERQLKELLDDCYALLGALQSVMEGRSDQYNLRAGQMSDVIARIQRELGFGYQSALRPPQWTKDDVVLLLRRIQETEKQLNEMKEKHSLLLQEMMQVENERDQANAKQQKAETELMQKEREVENLKAQRMEGGRNYQPAQNFSASQPILGGGQSYPTMYGSTTQYSCSAPILP